MNIQQMISCSSLCLLGLTLFACPVAAQVFDSGPSDPALFDIVYNLPQDTLPLSTGTFLPVVGGDGLTTQVNLSDSLVSPPGFGALSGTEVNIGRYYTRFFANAGTEINVISGGSVFNLIAESGSLVNINDGSVSILEANSGSVVNISGGTSGFGGPQLEFGSVMNISGGLVGANFSIVPGAEVNISGGSVGNGVNIFNGGVLNISGGNFGVDFDAFSGSEVNLFGSDFVLDGVLLDNSLTTDDAFTIVDRNVTLSGLLADGSPFSFDLSTAFVAFGDVDDRFEFDAALTVTLVSPVLLGDVNQDDDVNFLDISPFIFALSTGEFQAQADCNEDDAVNFLDIGPFITILSGN